MATDTPDSAAGTLASVPFCLTTERLHLREWRESDLEEYAPICADPEVMRYIGDGQPRTREETALSIERMRRGFADRGFGFLAATLRDTGRLAGFVGLGVPTFLPEIMPAVEIGWRLGRAFWGQGLATEGARAALADGFTRCAVDEIVSIYQPANAASGRIMEKIGMTRMLDTVLPAHGYAVRVYRITSDEWSGARPP
jgi:RimJ/RimL family protein N-acetyltransferase